MLKFTINGQNMSCEKPLVVSDTIKYIDCSFEFSSEWDGLNKYIHFKKGESVYDVEIFNDKVERTAGLNLASGRWQVYVHGHEVSGQTVTERITTNICIITVESTGVLNGEPFPTVTASVGEQIIARATAQASAATTKAAEASASASTASSKASEAATSAANANIAKAAAESAKASVDATKAQIDTQSATILTKVTEAQGYATSASQSATSASASAQTATTKASEASASATQARQDFTSLNNSKVGYAEIDGENLKMYADSTKSTLISSVPVSGGGSGVTYTFSISGHTITITPSEGEVQTITIPTDWTEQSIRTLITSYGYSTFSGNYNDLTNKPTIPTLPDPMYFYITEDMFDVAYDDTKGVAPYSTSYGYTNVTIHDDSGVVWRDGAIYRFNLDTKVATSTYRNVRLRIGENGDWKPLCLYNGSASSTYYTFVKAHNTTFTYDTRWFSYGSLTNVNTDTNTTYPYLVNTIICDTTDAPIKIDSNGYGARYSLMFATTPTSDSNGLVADERWSSLVNTSSTVTTKAAVTPTSGKFYIDRNPCYAYSANIAKDAKPTAVLYQDYTGTDLRFTCNTSNTYLIARRKCFLWLKNYNPVDMSFEADATVGNIMSLDKISARFPSTTTGDVYLYFLGWTGSSWYALTPAFTTVRKIYKYTPSTGKFVTVLNDVVDYNDITNKPTIPTVTNDFTDTYKTEVETMWSDWSEMNSALTSLEGVI